MGLGGLHIWHLLILLLVVLIIFGTKNLKNFGEDLGGAINGFKKAMNEGKDAAPKEQDKLSSNNTSQTTDTKSHKVDADK